jgi:TPR repeat protein
MPELDLNQEAFELYAAQKYPELIDKITPLVSANNPWAQAMMGQCYMRGLGVESDRSIAAHYFSLSAQQGDPQGLLLMGCYLLDEGDVEQGREALVKAFDLGILVAAKYIAGSYFNEKLPVDSESFCLGKAWLLKAEDAAGGRRCSSGRVETFYRRGGICLGRGPILV